LSKEERKKYNQSLKKFREMNLAVRDRDMIIRENSQKIALLSRDNAEKAKRIAELEQQLGLNGVNQQKSKSNESKRLLN